MRTHVFQVTKIHPLALLLPALLMAAPALLPACEGDLGSLGSGGGTDTGAGTGGSGGGGGVMPCSSANPCPSGMFCFNGLCALGCNSNEDCADDQYCDTQNTRLCQNREVPECSGDEQCAEGQVCVAGLCSTPPETDSCNPDGLFLGDDGCDPRAICFEDPDSQTEGQTACYTFPACADDDTCPVGTQGAVCNVDLIPNKDRICLVGMCTTGDHCPASWSCAVPTNQTLGVCTSGTAASPCTENGQCLSGVCQILQPGTLGFCA